MKLFKLTLSIILLSLVHQSYAQDKYLKDIESAKLISKDVTQLFKENKINEAINIIRPYWPLPTNEIDNVESKTIQSLNLISERFGKPEGIVKVNEQNIKEIALRETYILKFENTAIRLIFTYYKNNMGWILNAFKWDDNFYEEFK